MKYTAYLMRIIAAALLAALSPAADAAPALLPDTEPTWKNIAVDGRKMTVFCIYTDSRGLVWAGTDDGLFFYDGVAARPVDREGMAGVQIYSIVERDGTLYLGTNNGLRTYGFDGSGTTLPGLPKEIRALLEIDGTLWIAGLEGVYTFRFDSGEARNRCAGLPHRSVYSLLRDSRGIIYAGTYDGLARWNPAKNTFQKVPAPAGSRDRGLNLFINCMLEADDGQSIYIGSEGALLRYFPAGERWDTVGALAGNNVKCLARGAGNTLLAGTDDGIFELRGSGAPRRYRHDSRNGQTLPDNEIWCVGADKSGNIWAGHGKGMSVASDSGRMRTVGLGSLLHSGEGNEIHAICRDSRGDLWLGGTGGAIRIGAEDGQAAWYRHSPARGALSHNRVRAIKEDGEGRIWLATDGGINRFNPDGSFDVYHVVDSSGGHSTNWVYAIEESGARLWIGSYLGGVHRVDKSLFRPGGGTVVSGATVNSDAGGRGHMAVHMENDLVNKVVRDADGNIWILLFRTGNLTRLTEDGHSESHDIHALTGGYPDGLSTDSRGRIWCSFAGGAAVFAPHGGDPRVIHFPATASPTLAMGPVGDDMWISTQSGVWRIDGGDLGVSLLPLPQKGYTAVFGDKATGKVYLGGTDEILEADPARLGPEAGETPPQGAIFGLVLATDSPGSMPDLSDIRRGARGFSIPYAGSLTLTVSTLDYSPQAVQRYSWRLARANEAGTADAHDWIVMPEGTNTIILSDLSAGHYNILVRAIGSPGTGQLAIPLEVGRPWYLSTWAICLWILAAAAIVAGIIIYARPCDARRMLLRERRKALEDVERKLSFLAGISHDLKTPLSMILGPVSELREHASDPDERHTLGLVYDNAVRLNNMIHRTLELNHLDDGSENLLILSRVEAVEFCRDITETFRENHPDKRFVFHAGARQAPVEADAVKLESVLANLLSNACKYSGPGATVSVGVECDGADVKITVADDGMGIAEADQQLVFQRMYRAPEAVRSAEGTGIGLYLIKKYMQLMGGNVELYSRPGQGSVFTVTIPAAADTADDTGQTGTPPDDGARQILVVEDNRQIAIHLPAAARRRLCMSDSRQRPCRAGRGLFVHSRPGDSRRDDARDERLGNGGAHEAQPAPGPHPGDNAHRPRRRGHRKRQPAGRSRRLHVEAVRAPGAPRAGAGAHRGPRALAPVGKNPGHHGAEAGGGRVGHRAPVGPHRPHGGGKHLRPRPQRQYPLREKRHTEQTALPHNQEVHGYRPAGLHKAGAPAKGGHAAGAAPLHGVGGVLHGRIQDTVVLREMLPGTVRGKAQPVPRRHKSRSRDE